MSAPRWGELPAHDPSISTLPTIVSSHRIIFPPEHHLSPSQHTKSHCSLHQTALPNYLPRPRHACRIPNDVPLSPPRYLLPSYSASFGLTFTTNMAQCAPLLPCISSPCRKFQVSSSTPPTPPISPAACQCRPPVSGFLLCWVSFLLLRFSRYCPSSTCNFALSPV